MKPEKALGKVTAALLLTPEGRSSLWRTLRYPLLVSLQHHKAGSTYDLLREDALWALVEGKAVETGRTISEVFAEMLNTPVDPTANPPHPFAYDRGPK